MELRSLVTVCSKMFWSIDSEHTISQTLNYVPTRDEQKYLLNFKVSNQLLHKYPQEEGGVYLVPTSYNANSSKKYKGKLTFKSKKGQLTVVIKVDGDKVSVKAPSPEIFQRIISIIRGILHLEEDNASMPLSLGLRNGQVDLQVKVERGENKEALKLKLPDLGD